VAAALADEGGDARRKSWMEGTGDGGVAVEVARRKENPRSGGTGGARGRVKERGGRRKRQSLAGVSECVTESPKLN